MNFKSENLKSYWNLLTPYEWLNEFEIESYSEFVEWYNKTDKEEVIYNLLNMLHEENTKKEGK